jgi:hypothetical protein
MDHVTALYLTKIWSKRTGYSSVNMHSGQDVQNYRKRLGKSQLKWRVAGIIKNAVKLGMWCGCEGYVSVLRWNAGKVMMICECNSLWHYVFYSCQFLVQSRLNFLLVVIHRNIYVLYLHCIHCVQCAFYVLWFWWCVLSLTRPPLWSCGQSYWLLTQRSRVRFPELPDFLSSSGSGTGSTQFLWG